MRTRTRAGARSAFIALGVAAIVGAWAIPTFAGRSLVEVTSRIAVVGTQPVPGRAIVLPDGSSAWSGRLRVEIMVTNHYPLPVMVDFRGSAFRVDLVDRAGESGAPAWQASAEDSLLEQADDSPDGTGSPRVIRLAPGTTIVSAAELTLDLAATPAVAPGIYALQISAYGIAGTPQLLSIVDQSASGRRPDWASRSS
jgi:hypothetical protein